MTAPHASPDAALLEVVDLHVTFRIATGVMRSAPLHAVDGVSFSLARDETMGLVGESGSGKSTVGRAIVGIQPITQGDVLVGGRSARRASGSDGRRLRSALQMVFQDPYSSLNPRHRIEEIITEPLAIRGVGADVRRNRLHELLEMVGLDREMGRRFPYALSGGQRQRVAVARALSADPELVVLDEPVTALDVSIQAQLITLLERLQQTIGVAYLFIAHDLALVRHISHRVGVMYLGKLVELGPSEAIYREPRHPYTRALLSAVPSARRSNRAGRLILRGEIPSPLRPPSGCRFRTRCPWAQEVCAETIPSLRDVDGRLVACHFAEAIRDSPSPPISRDAQRTARDNGRIGTPTDSVGSLR